VLRVVSQQSKLCLSSSARMSAFATRLSVPMIGPMRRSNQITAFCTAARSAAAELRLVPRILLRALRSAEA
jgi:hypothetical protein